MASDNDRVIPALPRPRTSPEAPKPKVPPQRTSAYNDVVLADRKPAPLGFSFGEPAWKAAFGA